MMNGLADVTGRIDACNNGGYDCEDLEELLSSIDGEGFGATMARPPSVVARGAGILPLDTGLPSSRDGTLGRPAVPRKEPGLEDVLVRGLSDTEELSAGRTVVIEFMDATGRMLALSYRSVDENDEPLPFIHGLNGSAISSVCISNVVEGSFGGGAGTIGEPVGAFFGHS